MFAALMIVLLLLVNYHSGWESGFLQHASALHLVMNSFVILTFGTIVGLRTSGVRVLTLFALGGAIGQLVEMGVSPHMSVLGASGGALALVGAYAMWWPKERILTLPAPLFVVGWGVAEIIQILFELAPGVAHWAHLTGLLIGVFYAQMFDVRHEVRRK